MTVSGLPLQYTKRQIIGEYDSGDYRPVRVCASGEVVVCSGLYVVADIAESGLHVQISGQHVFVESGVHVVADIAESGLHVQISGQHVFVESGVHTIPSSGQHVVISGQPAHLYGYHHASGLWVPIAVTLSGCIAITYCTSGGLF